SQPENPTNDPGQGGIASPEPSGGLDSATCVACTMVVAGEPIPATEDGKCLECGRDLTAPATLEEAATACAPVAITVIKETLKVPLSDEDYKHFAIVMGQANNEISAAEDQLAAVKSQFKSRIDAAVARRNEYASIINSGCEYKPVECQLVKNYGDSTISKIRMDTGEKIETRAMSTDERQRGL